MNDALKNEILALEKRRWQAMLAGDTAALAELFDEDMVYTHSAGFSDDAASYIDGVGSGKFDYRRAETSGERVRIYGDTAIVNGRVAMEVVVAGTPKQLDSLYTCVWAKRGGAWKFASWQSTAAVK